MMYSLNNRCFLCYSTTLVATRVGVDLFNEETTLKSGKKLNDVVSEIISKPVVKEGIHADVLCKKCQKATIEYDCLLYRCETIKAELLEKFKQTLTKIKLNYDTYNGNAKSSVETDLPNKETTLAVNKDPVAPDEEKKSIVIERKKLILPASKLQPLPLNFIPRAGQFHIPKSNFTVVPKLQPVNTSSINLSSIHTTTQSVKTEIIPRDKTTLPSQVDPKFVLKLDQTKEVKPMTIPKSAENVVVKVSSEIQTVKSELGSMLKFNRIPTSKPESVYTLNVTSLPKELLSAAFLKQSKYEIKVEPENSDGEVADENPMEIDEDCSLTVITADKLHDKLYLEDDDKQSEAVTKENYLKLMPSDDVMKLQVLEEANEEDDGEEQTIVMDENGAIIRVVSGQKLVIGDNEISLVMPDEMDRHDNGDTLDSNEESQIELQVSGDEETAKAIIAAAQEKGGAFIKVESGEMFRVESVQSKERAEDSGEEETNLQVVRKKNGKYRCLFCEKYFKSELVFEGDAASMMQHLKVSHDARVYICGVCGKFIRRKADYVKHLANHGDGEASSVDKSKLYECNICQKKFSSRVFLQDHAHAHAGERPYACAVCHKTFASKYSYQSHVKTHTDRPRPYKCGQCSKSFFTQQNLTQHLKTHSGIRDFVCKICNKAFGTQHNLEVHGVVHSRKKPFACHCGKAFARRAELRDHARIHTGERPFACEVCGARFTQRSNLDSHRRATHMDDKRYCCDRCSKRFKRRRLLDYHIKAAHTGERPLQCEVCQATFVYPEHYKKHARIHSGEKPYVCEICGKSFNSRDNRNTHRFVHSDRKPYECLVCGAGYMRKQLLYQHMNTRGHMAESIVVNQPRLAGHEVAKATVAVEIKKDQDTSNMMFEATETLASADDTLDSTAVETKYLLAGDKQLVLEDGKSINISQDGEATLLTIHNIEGELKADNELLETVTVDHLDQAQVVTGDNVALMRLVQVQLADGNSGWVAVND